MLDPVIEELLDGLTATAPGDLAPLAEDVVTWSTIVERIRAHAEG